MKYGVCTWCLPGTMDQAMLLAKKIGFDCVAINYIEEAGEIWIEKEENQTNIRDISAETGVEIACIGVNQLCFYGLCERNKEREVKAYLDASLMVAKKIGVNVLQLPSFGAGVIKNEEDLKQTISCLQYICKKAEYDEILIGYESALTIEENKYVLEEVNSPNLFVYYDGGNLINANTADPVEFVKQLSPYIKQAHVKDSNKGEKKHVTGEYNQETFLCANILKQVGYTGVVLLENNYRQCENPEETGVRDLQLLKKYMQ